MERDAISTFTHWVTIIIHTIQQFAYQSMKTTAEVVLLDWAFMKLYL